MARRGFTLIELMIVVSVIVLLASLAIPAIGAVKRMATYAREGNNLRGLGAGIMAFQAEQQGKEVFPSSLAKMFHPTGIMAAEDPKIMISEMDPQRGLGTGAAGSRYARSNRPVDKGGANDWADVEYVLINERKADGLTPMPCNVFYEVSGTAFTHPWATNWMSRSTFTDWADYKTEQMLRGNATVEIAKEAEDANACIANGIPFDKNHFPIIRNFWHYPWKGVLDDNNQRKVICVSWNGNIFNSYPRWEWEYGGSHFTEEREAKLGW